MTTSRATAVAPSNIAFVKYWGKRQVALNLPAAGSLSMTLRDLTTTTTVEFDPGQNHDTLSINGEMVSSTALAKASPILQRVRAHTSVAGGARIVSENSFPTGAGLASSASGLCALAVAACAAAGWRPSAAELSALARLGSGSACRSTIGGFAEWLVGERADGADSHAVQVAPEEHWPLRMLVVVVQPKPKATSSTSGMARTASTSPYFDAFVRTVAPDLGLCKEAINDRDFEALTAVVESSCLKMHASMITSQPALWYWRPETLQVLECLYALRAAGEPLAFTIDAGPNVKVLLPPGDDDGVERALLALPAVKKVLKTGPGPGARVIAAGEPG